jgi:nicotinic acid phosphoribosyltransferase
MIDRSIDLFDIEQVNDKYKTTHIHGYLRANNDKTYAVYVSRYRMDGPAQVHPIMAARSREIERFGRFSAKRLTELAADPKTLNIARDLAGLE